MLALTFGSLFVASVLCAAALAPGAPTGERAVVASTLVPGLAVGLVHLLSVFHAITPLAWGLASGAVGLLAVGALGRRAGPTVRRDVLVWLETLREIGRDPLLVACVAAGATATGLAVLSAGVLEPWAWDALGYHLPIVHDALQERTLRVVPTSVVYVNAYPRLVDVFFVAWRLSLADETWIELGQLPFGLVGVSAIAAIARRAGVERGLALAGACLWLALPIVMLQLATAYVDVAVGALCLATMVLVTAPLERGAELAAAVSAGLLLGSKPSAPPLVAVALTVLLVRAGRAGRLRWGLLGLAITFSIGAWTYVRNLVEHANPTWPVTLAAGPLRFEGKVEMAELTTGHLLEPHRSMGWLGRLVSSWTAQPEHWVFDMRIGGFGPLFTFGLLPALAMTAVGLTRRAELSARARRVGLPVGLVVGATLATPGAFWSRYTLAVPGALLALVLGVCGELSPRARSVVCLVGAGLAFAGIGLSWRGLSEGGPTVLEIAALPAEERVTAFAVDAQEADWRAARGRVQEGEAFGYDWCDGLPGRLARRDGRGRVAFFEDTHVELDPLERWIVAEHVRVVALRDGPDGAAALARAHPERFEELFVSAYPDWQPCVVFAVRD